MSNILIDRSAIERRVAELGASIRRDAGPDTPLHMVAVLKGAFMFLADLMRACDGPVSCDFMVVSSYGEGDTSSGAVRIIKDLDHPITGRHVVIVEDIVDTGLTLSQLQRLLRERRPASLRTVTMLDKRSRRRVDVDVDYVGFTIVDRFVVGYGLDLAERHRNLPHVAVLDDAAAGTH